MQQSFFNTVKLSGNELTVANTKACKQSELILKVFKEYPTMKFTPFDVQYNVKMIYGKDYPITSVRARLTTLTQGIDAPLMKSETAEGKGIYKSPNHKWQLKSTALC